MISKDVRSIINEYLMVSEKNIHYRYRLVMIQLKILAFDYDHCKCPYFCLYCIELSL